MERKMSEQKLNIEFVKEVEKYPCIYDYRRSDYSRKDVIDKAWATIGEKINLSGPQCRERWKNLRTVLSRNLRPNSKNGQSRSSKQQRKPYYLFDAMKFAVPFVKSHNTVPAYFMPRDSSNSPSDQEAKAEDNTDEGAVEESICHIKVEVPDYNLSRTPSPQYSSPPPSPPPSPQVNFLEAPSLTTPTNTPPPQSQPQRTSRKRKMSSDTATTEREQNVAKYCKKKLKPKNKINDLAKISKKRFLLSLLPDVYSMNNTQMRAFRIKVLNLINDITQTSPTNETMCSVCQSNTATSSKISEKPPSRSDNISHVQSSVYFPQVAIKIEKEE